MTMPTPFILGILLAAMCIMAFLNGIGSLKCYEGEIGYEVATDCYYSWSKRCYTMMDCYYAGCEFVSEEMAAFQEHVNTKHVQQQQQQPQPQQLNLDLQNESTEKEVLVEGPMAKKAKLDEDNMIKIKTGGKSFLDHQVLAFFSLIVPHITTNNNVQIHFTMEMSHMDENRVASVKRLLQIFREKMRTIPSIKFTRCLSNIQFLPDVDNKMKRIDCQGVEESDIPIIMQFLASPRADGQMRVMNMYFCLIRQMPVARKLLDAIKEEFRTSTQPQTFYLKLSIGANLNILQSEEENAQTNETLTIRPNRRNPCFVICRHPRGQHEQCAEDAWERLIETAAINTSIGVDISEFGVPFSMASV